MTLALLPGTLHSLPDDLMSALQQDPDIAEKWNSLTALARNEWICRVTIVKKEDTRSQHIARLLEDIG